MQQELMQQWLQELRSGKYVQGQRCLKVNGRYCCLGIAAEVVLNMDSTKIDGFTSFEGSVEILPTERARELGLDEAVTSAELDTIRDITGRGMSGPDRQHILAGLNDCGLTFEQIADFIEKMGWDK